MRLLEEYENECKTKSSGQDTATEDSKPSSPVKLCLKENHYSDCQTCDTDNIPPVSPEGETEKSLIIDATSKLFSFVKTAMDSLDLLENDYETEESSASSYEKCSKGDMKIDSMEIGSNDGLEITIKEKGDMVVLGNGKEKGKNITI